MAKIKTTIKYGGVILDRANQDGAGVPTDALKITLPLADKKALAIAVKNNIPALLIGETGTGKTSAIKELAYLLKQKYTRISLTGYTTPDELIGSKSVKDGATYYEDGILTKAMREGHICVLDELNAITPDASFIIHSLLDDEHKIALPNGDIIEPHPNFRVFATINPDYEGTKSLNRAFLDRFGILIFVQILKPANEVKLLQERAGITKELATKLVAVAWLNRKAYGEGKTLTLISTRSLIQTCVLIQEGLTPAEAYKTAVINKARTDEHKAFLDFYNVIFKTADEYADTMPEVITPAEVKQRTEQVETMAKDISDLRNSKYTADDDIRRLNETLALQRDKIAQLEDKLNATKKDDQTPAF